MIAQKVFKTRLIIAKAGVKGPWNTGGSVATEDMPRKPLMPAVAIYPWLGVHEGGVIMRPCLSKGAGFGAAPQGPVKIFSER
ncbi:MAG TPA: hypothetical protein DIC42_02905 [Holosporales bacterium]|nr:hypothetical protein [Holosporales bacterium]